MNFSASENAHAIEHKLLYALAGFNVAKGLRKRLEIATLVSPKIGHLYQSDLPLASVPNAFAPCTPKLCP